MKINTLLLVIIAIVLTSCTSGMPAQKIEVTEALPTETVVAEVTMTQTEVVITREPTATETPTKTPSITPSGCVTLLTPADNVEIPAVGKATFSWDPVNRGTFYVLHIVLPSGTTVSFETKETFREQFMEAFPAGGKYQWKVIVQDRKKGEICSSEFATFSKSVYYPPKQTSNKKGKK